MDDYDGEVKEEMVEEVCMSGLVALKIIKHCKENIPELVTGQLLGLDNAATLEVTNCFPFLTRGGDNEDQGEKDSGAEYQIEMMRYLRDVNVDSNLVGWYQSTYLGSFMNLSMLESQFTYQDNIRKCVVIVYDPVKTIQGTLSLQAFRLTNQFMKLYREQDFSPDKLAAAGKTHADIFEEIPIKIQNTSLANALLYELESRGVVPKPDPARLETTSNQLLEKNMEFLIEESEELISEQNKLQYHYRALQRQQQSQSKWIQQRKQENAARRRKGQEELPEKGDESDPVWKPIPPPPQLESLLITNQIQYYCEQGNKLLGASLDKHMIMNGLSKR
jgi:translation initiation factor 3 subunit H